MTVLHFETMNEYYVIELVLEVRYEISGKCVHIHT